MKTFDKRLDFFMARLYGDMSDPLKAAIDSSYGDVSRTITGFSKDISNDIYDRACDIIYRFVVNIINAKDQSTFDKNHDKCCNDLLKLFMSINQEFYYGQAQKWINMTLKNYSMLDPSKVERIYEFCHIPVDSYILEESKYPNYSRYSKRPEKIRSWSKMDKDKYKVFQDWFRYEYGNPREVPLDKEFDLWLEAKSKK